MCIFVLNRKWYLGGSHDIPLLKCKETLLLIRARIFVFLGTYVAWIMCLLKFQMSHAVFHSFLISEYIHMIPDIFAPSDLR